MQSYRDTLTLQFIFGPPKQKGKANGIFFQLVHVTLTHLLLYAKSVGAERWNIAKASLSGDLHTDVFLEGS
jgi:hypothetical protein